jgi:6-phosphogluconolactonase
MRGEEPEPSQAARDYEVALCRAFDLGREEALHLDGHARSPLRFDLLVAGVGADGHTASLFPGTGAVARTNALVTVVHPGGDLEPRLTLTRPVLVAARAIAILCSGSDKRRAVEDARRPGDEEQVPARLYLSAEPGSVTWFVDAAARG